MKKSLMGVFPSLVPRAGRNQEPAQPSGSTRNHQFKMLPRRAILEMALGVGGFALTRPMAAFAQQSNLQLTLEQMMKLTPEQIMGPFYPLSKPLDRDADLTVIKGKRGRAQGKVIHLMGRIVNLKGEPVRGAKIELWQANTHGRYAHPSDPNQAPLDPLFQGYATQVTDREGQYRFKTIKPGAYGINPMRPPHIHFDIAGKYDRLVTQMYFPNEPLNESDVIFGALDRQARDLATGKLLAPTADVEPDSVIVRWDVILTQG